MSNYIRSKLAGGTYFFTVVTYNRLPIFTNEMARSLLKNAYKTIQSTYPFKTVAICLLPDHLHCIWQLPEYDHDYSKRWRGIKSLFSKSYRLNDFAITQPNVS